MIDPKIPNTDLNTDLLVAFLILSQYTDFLVKGKRKKNGEKKCLNCQYEDL